MPTRKLGFTALLTAVYSRLTTHALTNTYTFRNYVKRSDAMPYHVIGKPKGHESLSYKTRDTEAEENIIQIDSWVDETSGKGDKPCLGMMNNIIQAITGTALTITGYSNPDVFLDYSDILEDDTEPGKIIYHGIIRLRFEMAPK